MKTPAAAPDSSIAAGAEQPDVQCSPLPGMPSNVTVADRDLMLSASLIKWLINHVRPQDVSEGYAADWTIQQLRDAVQKVADRIDTLVPQTAVHTEFPP